MKFCELCGGKFIRTNAQFCGMCGASAPAPVEVEPVTPAPVEVEPVAPAPVEVEPVAPAPVEVEPVAPAPVKVEPVAPAPVEVEPVAPAPVEAKANASSKSWLNAVGAKPLSRSQKDKMRRERANKQPIPVVKEPVQVEEKYSPQQTAKYELVGRLREILKKLGVVHCAFHMLGVIGNKHGNNTISCTKQPCLYNHVVDRAWNIINEFTDEEYQSIEAYFTQNVHYDNRKTRGCKYYNEGVCWKADSCSFAHGDEDLRPVP
jgi:hypothetical protein